MKKVEYKKKAKIKDSYKKKSTATVFIARKTAKQSFNKFLIKSYHLYRAKIK